MLGGLYLGEEYIGVAGDPSLIIPVLGVPNAASFTGLISTPASAVTVFGTPANAVAFTGLLVVAGFSSAATVFRVSRVNFNTPR